MYLHSVPILFLCFIYLICVDSNHQSEKIEGQFLLLQFEFLEFLILFNMNPDIRWKNQIDEGKKRIGLY